MQFRDEMDELLTFAPLSIQSYYHKNKLFLEALSIGSKSAPNTPIILPPELFLNELIFIQNQISGKELALPMPVSHDNLAAYYQIATTRSRVMNDQVLLSLSIPLLNLKEYQLFKVTSLPTPTQSGIYQFILPEYEYIAVDQFQETYVTLTTKELEACHDLRDISNSFNIICIQNSPIFQITPARDDCSITLLTANNRTQRCDTRLSHIKTDLFLKLQRPNSWIGVFPETRILYVRCPNINMFDTQVEWVGILTLGQECQLKTHHTFITAQHSFQSQILTQIIPPVALNLSSSIPHLTNSQTSLIKTLDTPYVISHGELLKLKGISSSLQDITITSRPDRIIKYDISQLRSQTILSTIMISASILASGFLVIIVFQCTRTHSYRPRDNEIANSYMPSAQLDSMV